MSLRTQPLPIIFAVTTLWMAAVVGSVLAISGCTDPVVYIGFAIGVAGVTTLLTVVVARQRRRERLGTLSEPLRYRIAIQTGEVSGDVSRWPAWIRRDLKLTIVSMVLFPIVPALFGLMMYLEWILGVDVHPWSMVPLSVVFGIVVWQQWRMRQRLWTLAENLSAAGALAESPRELAG